MVKWCDNSCFDASHCSKRMSWCECEMGMSEPIVNIKKKTEPVSKKIENKKINNNIELIEISINGKTIKGTPESIRKLLDK